jgi:glyoxylate reductase
MAQSVVVYKPCPSAYPTRMSLAQSVRGANVLVTRPIPEAGLAPLRAAGVGVRVLQMDPDAPVDRNALLEAGGEADVLLCLLTEQVDSALLERAPRLRGVANMAVGYNNIDVAAATAAGVPVSNTPGVLTETTADLTWALLLAVARRIPEAHAFMTAGRFSIWGPQLLLGADVGTGPDGARRTLGIIGFGRIGAAVARRARGFDMRVLAWTPRSKARIDAAEGVEYAPLDQLLADSDFVSLHASYSAESHHIIDECALRLMKPSAYLINVARGELVDESALVRALNGNWIAGAALDVFEREPAMAPGLAECRNAVLVPHIGSATHATRGRMAAMAAHNALAHLGGERAPNAVNPDVYDTDAYRKRMSGLHHG